jgi:fimbrial chaperone protein
MRNETSTVGWRILAAGGLVTGLMLLSPGRARAQALTVLPVNIELAPGQMTSTLTVINDGDTQTSIQVRALDWGQKDGVENLAPSSEVMASPPIATIDAGATQVIRLVIRKPPKGKEASYRILVDQIPPAAAPGTVRLALRLSIPVFAPPETRALPHVAYHVETDCGRTSLVAVNDGGRHDTIRNVVLTGAGGASLETTVASSPYILAGATRRWNVESPAGMVVVGQTLTLKGVANAGAFDQPVSIVPCR